MNDRIQKAKCLKKLMKRLEYELSRLKNMSANSCDGNNIKAYLDWVLHIPWDKYTKDSFDVKKARKILDDEHYGLEDVKDRIIEYLAVKQFSKS